MATSKQDAEKSSDTRGKILTILIVDRANVPSIFYLRFVDEKNAGPDIKCILATWVFSTDFTRELIQVDSFPVSIFFSLQSNRRDDCRETLCLFVKS